MFFQSIFFLLSVMGLMCEGRTLTAEANPECPHEICTHGHVYLVYGQSMGSKDCLHFLFSKVGPSPSLMIAKTNPEAKLSINWPEFLNMSDSSISFLDNTSLIANTFTFRYIIEYDDINKMASPHSYMKNSSAFVMKNLTDPFVDFNMKDFSIKMTWNETNGGKNQFLKGGFIDLDFNLFHGSGRIQTLPRPLFNANSSLLDATLHDLNTTTGFNCARFAFGIIAATNLPPLTQVAFENRSTDDEYSPGVFRQHVIKTGIDYDDPDNSFFWQQKLASYTFEERSRVNTTGVHISTPVYVGWSDLTGTLSHALWGPEPVNPVTNNPLSSFSFVVSFGFVGDKKNFYPSAPHRTMTVLMGFGSPPADKMSPGVISIISIGFGVPILIALVAATWMIVKRYRSTKPTTPASLAVNEDDDRIASSSPYQTLVNESQNVL